MYVATLKGSKQMKSVIMALLSFFLLVTSCCTDNAYVAYTKKYNMSRQTLTSVQLVTVINSLMNGVILGCDKDEQCKILTAAHGCHPDVVATTIASRMKSGTITEAEAVEQVEEIRKLAAKGRLCIALIKVTGHNSIVVGVPTHINLNTDLMVLTAKVPKYKYSTDVVRTEDIAVDVINEEVYMMSLGPGSGTPIISHGRVGAEVKSSPDSIDTQYTYRVVDVPAVEGMSGSPVYMSKNNRLMSILSAIQIEGVGNGHRTIYSLIISPQYVKGIIDQAITGEHKDDYKSGRPYCIGEDDLCKVVRGEKPFLDTH